MEETERELKENLLLKASVGLGYFDASVLEAFNRFLLHTR